MFGEVEFKVMKNSVYFVNVVCGGLVDMEVLYEVLKYEEIVYVVLDVMDSELFLVDYKLL